MTGALVGALLLLTVSIVHNGNTAEAPGIIPAILAWILLALIVGVRLWG